MASNMDDNICRVPRWKLTFVLSELLNFDKDESDATLTDVVEGDGGRHTVCPMSRVFELAANCCRTQRWDAAAKFFPAVARHRSSSPIAVWKLGAACLAYHPDSNKAVMSNFASAMIQCGGSASAEVLLDHLVYLMCNAEFEEAKQFIENYKKKCPKSESDSMWAIFQGIRGLLEYISWQSALKLQENMDEEALGPLEAMADAATIVNYADKAINYLKSSLCCQGNFDVFVIKLTEILEYYERLEEADQALTLYLQLNHRHPTPYIFIFNFICKHYPLDVPRQIYILKELARVCPCDSHVLKLCKLLSNEEIESKIQLLFDFVDYNEWRNNVDVWKMLMESVLALEINNKKHLNNLRGHINERSPWWAAYHFRVEDLKISDTENRKLMVYKALMVTVMFHSGHVYVKTVLDKFSEIGDEDNAGMLNDLLVKGRQVGEALKAMLVPDIEIIHQNRVKKVYFNQNSEQHKQVNATSCFSPSQQLPASQMMRNMVNMTPNVLNVNSDGDSDKIMCYTELNSSMLKALLNKAMNPIQTAAPKKPSVPTILKRSPKAKKSALDQMESLVLNTYSKAMKTAVVPKRSMPTSSNVVQKLPLTANSGSSSPSSVAKKNSAIILNMSSSPQKLVFGNQKMPSMTVSKVSTTPTVVPNSSNANQKDQLLIIPTYTPKLKSFPKFVPSKMTIKAAAKGAKTPRKKKQLTPKEVIVKDLASKVTPNPVKESAPPDGPSAAKKMKVVGVEDDDDCVVIEEKSAAFYQDKFKLKGVEIVLQRLTHDTIDKWVSVKNEKPEENGQEVGCVIVE